MKEFNEEAATGQFPSNIIGVACIATGRDGGTWAYVDESGNAIMPSASYFNDHPVFGGIRDMIVDGQDMVKIPKFYTKRAPVCGGVNNGKEAWWISDQLIDGFTIHPAFRSGGSDIDQIYVGKYQASSDGSKMQSIPGVIPGVSKSLTTFQGEAAARNTGDVTGFMLWSAYHWSAIQWLYLVENATMNCQAKTGAGRVNRWSVANVDASDVAQATYRGIVGLWGNVWQWMDGFKTIKGVINLWDRDGNKEWVSTEQMPAALNEVIYPVTFLSAKDARYDFGDLFVAATSTNSIDEATAPALQYFGKSREYFPYVGGYWSDGVVAGLWFVICYGDASNASTYLGARLAKV